MDVLPRQHILYFLSVSVISLLEKVSCQGRGGGVGSAVPRARWMQRRRKNLKRVSTPGTSHTHYGQCQGIGDTPRHRVTKLSRTTFSLTGWGFEWLRRADVVGQPLYQGLLEGLLQTSFPLS
jgi:hypothetical protein